MIPIEITAAAQDDYSEAYDWYASQSSDAASRFESAFDAALSRISEGPHRLSRIDRKYRQCLLPSFPYQIVYCQKDGGIQIVAVAHAKRRPNYWRKRK